MSRRARATVAHSTIAEEGSGEVLGLGDLLADPANARVHTVRNIGMIAEGLQEVGAARSIVINGANKILAGHGVTEAAGQVGIEHVRVIEASGNELIAIRRRGLTPEAERRLALFDNRAGELSSWDMGQLAAYRAEDATILNGLFTADEEALMFAGLAQAAERTGQGGDEYDDAGGPTRVQVGDVWEIGPHRLVCGDATQAEAWQAVAGEAASPAALVFTSPPYNAGRDAPTPRDNEFQRSRHKYQAVGDDMVDPAAYGELLHASLGHALEAAQYVFYNLQSLAGNKRVLLGWLATWAPQYADTIIWDKQVAEPAMHAQVVNSRFEYIHAFSRKGTRALGTRHFRGTVDNVLALPSRADKAFAATHQATFPVALAQYFAETFMEAGEWGLDCFAGTGTWLIAAARTARRAGLIEREPAYCDLILRRAAAEGIGPIHCASRPEADDAPPG